MTKTMRSKLTTKDSIFMSYQQRRPQRRFHSNNGRSTNVRRKNQKQYIHPSKFVSPAVEQAETHYTAEHTFADFALHPLLHRNIEALGFTTPTQIQDEATQPILDGRDVIGIANTGTGKTAAFSLPILTKLISDSSARALVIAPTRELAQQIEAACRDFAKHSGLRGAVLIGGSPMGAQIRDLKANPSMVIGTPGRIKDHVERRTLDLGRFNIVVLDEVDRMLDMGFIGDIRSLLGELATKRQSLFFSATIDPKINQLIREFSEDPVSISVRTSAASKNVEQDIVAYETTQDKLHQLHDLLTKDEVSKVLLFDDTQRSVERLSKELIDRGFKADAIHGGKSQGQRQRALRRFRDSEVKVLVATDVAARGIDVADVSHVINYSQPQSYDDYVHRIGRAGRAGRSGYAYTFVSAS